MKNISTLVKFIAPLRSSSLREQQVFLREHAIQPSNVTNFNLNHNRQDGNVLKRQWLSYSSAAVTVFVVYTWHFHQTWNACSFQDSCV